MDKSLIKSISLESMVKTDIMDNNLKNFLRNYITGLNNELLNIDINKFKKISDLIIKTIKSKNTIYVCGNGGSSAISNHYICDYLKLIRHNTNLIPKVIGYLQIMNCCLLFLTI